MPKNEDVLLEVDAIIGALQSRHWHDHDEATMLAAQGKLAVYQANVASLVADALGVHEMRELHAKQVEDDAFLAARRDGCTDKKSQALARSAAYDALRSAIEAKKQLVELRGVLNAMESLQTAIQVQLRNTHREAINSRNQPG